MSWDESLHYTHQLMGVHPWTGYMIDVVAHQQTLKEARHEMQVAREFTHERTKQRITHLNALAMVPAAKARFATPQGLPQGQGMMRWADRYFIQQQLGEMNLKESAFVQRPTLLGAQPESPECEQFNSTQEDTKEEDDKATSALDAKLDASTGEETDASGRLVRMSSAEWATEGTAPCAGSTLGSKGNFGGPRIDASVFPCSGKPPRRMLSLTGTGAVRLKMPWNMAMMPPR